MGFQIYQETGLTPAPATRTAAVINQGFPRHSVKHVTANKENQFSATAAADAVKLEEEEEPMAVDWVNIAPIFLS